MWTLRNLAEEVDKFSSENARLEVTAGRLNTEVAFLGTKKDELTGHVTKLEGTVGDLKGVSESLQNELVQFEGVQVSGVLCLAHTIYVPRTKCLGLIGHGD